MMGKVLSNWLLPRERCHWWLTVALSAFLLVPAFILEPTWKDGVIYGLLLLVVAVGVYSFRGYPVRLGVSLVTGLLVILLNAWPLDPAHSWVFVVRMLSLFFFFGWLLYYTLRRLAIARKVRPAILFCAVNGYLLIGLMGGLGFRMIHHFYPGSFRMAEGLVPRIDDLTYFSFITFASLGYGDISPVSPPAQSLSLLLSVAGQLYTAIVIALLVGKYTFYRSRKD